MRLQQLQLDLENAKESLNAVKASPYDGAEIGTFKDSLRAPVHRWFRYPAGYSYEFVNTSFDLFGVAPGDWVYDPFSGTGTTIICAKQRGINGYSVEAHSFVHWVADVKLYWEFDLGKLSKRCEELLKDSRTFVAKRLEDVDLDGVFPELVYKCYHTQDLKVLYLLREFIVKEVKEPEYTNLLKLALTETLRGAAAAGTGWPYISPRKNNGDKPPKDALAVFENALREMYSDIRAVRSATQDAPSCTIRNVLGDSRNKQDLKDGQVKLALTSPPYLNNYDYSDRTRLETYFWGITKSWRNITRDFRDKLLVAATTQVNRSEYNVKTALSTEIEQLSPNVYRTLQDAILRLADLRPQKGGKKDYDLMVALYFNGILKVVQETFRVLMQGGHFCLVLGDSAPYGVHIETENMIGELGLSLGFRQYDYHELRKRGDKWRNNPQRHNVKLREGIVILTK
jgi:DNA modification methylase